MGTGRRNILAQNTNLAGNPVLQTGNVRRFEEFQKKLADLESERDVLAEKAERDARKLAEEQEKSRELADKVRSLQNRIVDYRRAPAFQQLRAAHDAMRNAARGLLQPLESDQDSFYDAEARLDSSTETFDANDSLMEEIFDDED